MRVKGENDMRKEFIKCKSYNTAKRKCSFGNAIIAKTEGGFICFESEYDYKIWNNQK